MTVSSPARTAERGCLSLAAAALVAKVGVEAGLPRVLLLAALLLAAACALQAWRLGRGKGGALDGWRALLIVAGLACVPQIHTRVGGDGFEYFALARSLVFDQDLRFDNEFAGLGAQVVRTREGEPTSRFPVGLPLLWVPALAVARLVAFAGNALGAGIDTTGFSSYYQSAATTTSFALALAGLALLERLLRRLFSPPLSALTLLAIFFATPLHFYAVANPSMSHAASAGAATLFLACWWRARDADAPRPWLVTGLAGGAMSLIRIQDGALFVVPVVDGLLRRKSPRTLAALAVGPVLAAALQLLTWWAMYGPGFLGRAAEQGHFGRPELNVVGVLLSARHGLLTWTPVYALALLGLLLWLARDARLALALLAAVLASVALNSLQWDWWGADAFGQRRLLGLTPLLALGLAQALLFLERRPLLPLAAALFALAVWNQQFAYIYNSELIAGKGQAVSLERLAPAQVEVATRRLLRWEPLLPRRAFVLLYDNLRGVWLDEGARSLGGSIELGDREPDAFPLVGHGWSEPAREDGASFRYTNVRRSWLRVPILTPGDFEVTLRIRAAFDEAPVSVALEAGGERVGDAALAREWQEHRFALPARLLQPGVNELALAFSTTPAEVVPGFRGRNAAAAVDWLRFRRLPRGL